MKFDLSMICVVHKFSKSSRKHRKSTLKLRISLVSPGSGLTVACFNFPFSEKQWTQNTKEINKIKHNFLIYMLPLSYPKLGISSATCKHRKEILVTCSTNSANLMQGISECRFANIWNTNKHYCCSMITLLQLSYLVLYKA